MVQTEQFESPAAAGALAIEWTREQRLLILLSRLSIDHQVRDQAEALLAEPLDWDYVIPQAARHKCLHLVWDNLRRQNLIRQAIRSGGLTKLWTVYLNQLHWANAARNQLFLHNAGELAAELARAGIEAVGLKGAILIGTKYSESNRMLHDIDMLARRADLERISELMFRNGYRHGVFDDATGALRPMESKVARFWTFQNHTVPPYYKASGYGHSPFYKISIGFDFFDQSEHHEFPSEQVIDASLPKPGTPLRMPSAEHMVINLCSHIYREGVSLVYSDTHENFQLIKFCDLREFLRSSGGEIDRPRLLDTLRRSNLEEPFYYALHYTHLVYGDDDLRSWRDLIAPAATAIDQLVDGDRRVTRTDSIQDRIFTTGLLPGGNRGGFNRIVARDDW